MITDSLDEKGSFTDIAYEFEEMDFRVVFAEGVKEAKGKIAGDASFDAIVLEWPFKNGKSIIEFIRRRNSSVPLFLLREKDDKASLAPEILEQVSEIADISEDTAPFIAGRIVRLCEEYSNRISPDFFKALLAFASEHEYSWHTPGHTGGTAFLKTAIGLKFYDYFGENMLRSDLSISVDSLGSLLDHSGPIGDSEKYIARVFGADRSYTVTNGTSTSNRVVYAANVSDGDAVICDRNCHKSIEQALTMTGGCPAYLLPERNYLGIIGPIPEEQMRKEALAKLAKKPKLATVTNSTYDGICYNAKKVAALLGASTGKLHFDEAWYGYAKFNEIYADHFAMAGDPADYPKTAPTLFATQSTHKLLAALSQASYIHKREGRAKVPHERFNEAFMMHASTSPLYPIIASNEISAAMMDEAGEFLTTESIREACEFRQEVMRYNKLFSAKVGDWFFKTWNPEKVRDPKTKNVYAFEDAPLKLLTEEQEVWTLKRGEKWHGYKGLKDGYAMLDPIKVSVITPGVKQTGELAKVGIPAALLTAYLENKGIVAEKTADFSVLFLFSLGITNGKWATLLSAMLSFKNDYDSNAPLADVLPKLAKENSERYGGYGLKDLAEEMFGEVKKLGSLSLQNSAFSALPKRDMLPREAYEKLVRGEVSEIPLDEASGKTAATGIVPYPPGIPLLMPGENFGAKSSPFIKYLKALEKFDLKFPGFGHDIHGIKMEGGGYRLSVVRPESKI
jgi:lysine decarboxylase/arginine decarboxylase